MVPAKGNKLSVSNPLVNILIAYPYFKKDVVTRLEQKPRDSYRLIVDSGAFTAWNTGKTITLDGYCQFLDSISHLRPFNAVQLDVFGDPEGSYKNLCIMQDRGYDVMPVFTRGDTVERLEQFYIKTDYIMFGGITIGGKNKNYMKWFLRQNKNRRAHWLGFCNMDFVKAFKPFSVDSSSWSGAERFGGACFYAGNGKTVRISRKDSLKVLDERILRHASNVGLSKSDVLLLQKNESWEGRSNDAACKVLSGGVIPAKSLYVTLSALAYIKLAYDCEKQLGTRYFIALGNVCQLELVLSARKFMRARGVLP